MHFFSRIKCDLGQTAYCYDHIKPRVDLLAHGLSWASGGVLLVGGDQQTSSGTPFEQEQPSIDDVNLASSSSKHRVTGCNPERTVELRLDSSVQDT